MTTFNASVAASADDAFQDQDGTVTLTDTAPICDKGGVSSKWLGFRFDNVTVPNGATISSAYLTIYIGDSTEDEPNHTVYMENADDAAQFTTTADDIVDRTRTTGVSWDSTNLGAPGSFDSPDLASDVQTVVNRAGWASGQAMAVLISGPALFGDPGSIRPSMYDHATDAAPQLTIIYTTGSEGNQNLNADEKLGIKTTVKRVAHANRVETENAGFADNVMIGVERMLVVSENLGFSDAVTNEALSDFVERSVSEKAGFADNVLIAVNKHEIVVSDTMGFGTSAGPPEVDPPTANFAASAECSVVATDSFRTKQTQTTENGVLTILIGHRYRR